MKKKILNTKTTAQKPAVEAKPPDNFGEKIGPIPSKLPATEPPNPYDEPVFREHDEFGEWLRRDS